MSCLLFDGQYYHLLIETPDANLAKGMRQLNGVYTQRLNSSKNRVGHVFQGRYKAMLIEQQSYFVEVARYILLNPVRAQMVRSAVEWRWSSYRAMIGQIDVPEWLEVDWLLASFSVKKGRAINDFKQFVADGKNQPSPFEELRSQVYLGDDRFVEKMLELVDEAKDLSEIPCSQRRLKPKLLTEYEFVKKGVTSCEKRCQKKGVTS